MNIEQARFNMIEQQVKPWKVFSQKVLGAMSALPREQFISKEQIGLAYADVQLPIGHQQNMLAPREIARLIQALELKGDEKVLDLGTGTGYSAALLAKLSRKVYSVDIVEDFVKSASKTLKKLAIDNVTVEEGDASEGWMSHAPYDAILMSSALPKLTDNLKKNLSKNGRVVSILEHKGILMATFSQLDENDQWQHEYLFPIETPKMINSEKTNKFVF